jgi:prepilin-type N-terminal cleavage/methylation domain-containing protein
MKREKERNNKGFSLVELIVVIAIMVVLVAVLAPRFTKYIEQSRRATDVTNANTIAESILVDVADGVDIPTSAAVAKPSSDTDTSNYLPSSIGEAPEVKGSYGKGGTFSYTYDETTNSVSVYITADSSKNDLTSDSTASDYKNSEILSGSASND